MMTRLSTILFASLLAVGGVQAQNATGPLNETFATPYLDSRAANPEQLKNAAAVGESMVRDILESYNTLKTPEMERQALQLKRKFDDIADASIAAEREKVLDFLGIDPQADTGLFYFVSWSMPLEMLRSVVVEAMWSGGTVVFKGVPPGKELGSFVTNDLRQLVYGKGAAVNISIDPRLFDVYNVTTVPALVFTTVRDNMQCQGLNPVSLEVGGLAVSYDTCPPLDPETYWKVTGAVTSSYALEAFIDSGAEGARPYLRALSKGFQSGEKPSKEQQPFAGKWEDAISPSELLAAQEAAGLVTRPVPKPD